MLNMLCVVVVRLYQVLTRSGGGPWSYSDKAMIGLRSARHPVRQVLIEYGDWGWDERRHWSVPIQKWWMRK